MYKKLLLFPEHPHVPEFKNYWRSKYVVFQEDAPCMADY